MRRSNPLPDPLAESGSAAVEFLALGVLLLVPVVYLVLVLATLQAAAFAAEGAARQAARELVLAPTDGDGRRAAASAVAVGLADWRIPVRAAAVTIGCTPDPADCLAPRGTATVTVQVAVPLPLLPPVLRLGAPGAIGVRASATQRVSMFQAANR